MNKQFRRMFPELNDNQVKMLKRFLKDEIVRKDLDTGVSRVAKIHAAGHNCEKADINERIDKL